MRIAHQHLGVFVIEGQFLLPPPVMRGDASLLVLIKKNQALQ